MNSVLKFHSLRTRGYCPLIEPRIDILMSVYNGEKFLADQLESLVRQTHQNWRLLVRNDNSTDSSVRILHEYCIRYPKKIVLVSDDCMQLGACQGFAKVLQHSSAEYIMFCDQDDVWLPTKVEASLNELMRLEIKNPGMPILVYTDLTVVDEKLRVLAESLWQYQRIDPRNNSLNALLLENVATGCTMIFNRKLKEQAEPLPSEAVMHDWWLALVGSVYGRLSFLSGKTVLYRQHGRNDVGAQERSFKSRLCKFMKSPNASFVRSTRSAARVRAQCRALLAHVQCRTVPDPTLMIPLQRYVDSTNTLVRKWCLIRHKMLTGDYIQASKKLFYF